MVGTMQFSICTLGRGKGEACVKGGTGAKKNWEAAERSKLFKCNESGLKQCGHQVDRKSAWENM